MKIANKSQKSNLLRSYDQEFSEFFFIDKEKVQLSIKTELDLSVLDEARNLIRENGDSHLWRNFNDAQSIVEYERSLRETYFFTYTALIGKRVHTLGLGSVARSVHHSFADPGFPVVARAFVFPKFRKLGIHSLMLRHRVHWCNEKFAKNLCGIHLGTDDVSVEGTALKFGFSQIGVQSLPIGISGLPVKAFLLPTDLYKQELLQDPYRLEFENLTKASEPSKELCSLNFSPCGRLYNLGRAIPLQSWSLNIFSGDK